MAHSIQNYTVEGFRDPQLFFTPLYPKNTFNLYKAQLILFYETFIKKSNIVNLQIRLIYLLSNLQSYYKNLIIAP